MQVIISHVNTDFDALASMVAAKKLYPEATLVLSDKQNDAVKQFLNIYRDVVPYTQDRFIEWDKVTEIIIVDVASLKRTGQYSAQINRKNVKITLYDHHLVQADDLQADIAKVELVGAAVTLLIEEIQTKNITLTAFEATIFGLGIYTDTGSFTFSNTTTRDFLAASYLMEQGMNLAIIKQFADQMLLPEQQEVFNALFTNMTDYKMDGLNIIVATHQQEKFQGGLSTLTRKLLEMTDADAVLAVVEMQKRVYLVGRASSKRVNFLPLLKLWQGGGHEQAGSAFIKNATLTDTLPKVIEQLGIILKPAITARDMMTTPVKTMPSSMTIEEAGQQMYRYGHSGFPVVEDGKLLGIISRRDLDKAKHHGLGHAPVKGYMSSQIVTIKPDTSLEEIQQIMIEHNIGRLPVVEDGKLLGILSRTNVIEVLHNENVKLKVEEDGQSENQLAERMRTELPTDVYQLLQKISKTAATADISAFLIGGIVRDIMLGKPNDDIDIVVEGDGIAFAKQLAAADGGKVTIHESFKTATWEAPNGRMIDVTSSRLEYYERPAALPAVELSTLSEDLERRDFTINAMGIYLTGDKFGELVDPFYGAKDLQAQKIRILHNLSFVEDPTRIFRGVRFEARFGFKMDEQTEHFALQAMPGIKELSAHRILEEMKKLFAEISAEQIVKRLFELGFWQQFGIANELAEISCTNLRKYQSFMEKRKQFVEEVHWFTYFLFPFDAAGNLADAKEFALTKAEAKILHEVMELKKIFPLVQPNTVASLHQQLKNYSTMAIFFHLVKAEQVVIKNVMDYVVRRHQLPTYLTGADLIKKGLKPGAHFSEILSNLEVATIKGEVNSKATAEAWLTAYIEAHSLG